MVAILSPVLRQAAAAAAAAIGISTGRRPRPTSDTPFPPPAIPGPLPTPTAGTDIGDGAGDLSKSRSRTRERECKCPPDKGQRAAVNHSMPETSAVYQQYVTGFPRGIEWKFAEKDFDGFQSDKCLLQEAKAKYDQFINDATGEFEGWWQGKIGMYKQAMDQNAIAVANSPAKLCWYFMTPKTYRHCTRVFAREGYMIVTVYYPMG